MLADMCIHYQLSDSVPLELRNEIKEGLPLVRRDAAQSRRPHAATPHPGLGRVHLLLDLARMWILAGRPIRPPRAHPRPTIPCRWSVAVVLHGAVGLWPLVCLSPLVCRRWSFVAGLSPLVCRHWSIAVGLSVTVGLSPLDSRRKSVFRRWSVAILKFEVNIEGCIDSGDPSSVCTFVSKFEV